MQFTKKSNDCLVDVKNKEVLKIHILINQLGLCTLQFYCEVLSTFF